MPTAYVTEYATIGIDEKGRFIQAQELPALRTQEITYTTTQGDSLGFLEKTKSIRIAIEDDANGVAHAVGVGPGEALATPTTGDEPFYHRVPEVRGVQPGGRISFVAPA